MTWETIGTVTPDGGDWFYFSSPLSSRLIRLTYSGDSPWLEKFKPRAYLRLKIGTDGYSEDWNTIWPKTEFRELLLLEPIPIAPNTLGIRKRRNPYSLGANYSVMLEEFQADPYLIDYG